ncbi:probable serine/threonine-protein kinase PBL11 isoform X2 [Solanum pennellii]|uniref:Probable serine/threonine-protein kinase PBL11 isoform X2 n=1 Tax=Solanum pennellii TaxID=28526 RepID=A0ABM1FXE7_SOLPN|nr:probable serine/threonine-protein kinase PBL11 isoform X2 [Solanum pennellii]
MFRRRRSSIGPFKLLCGREDCLVKEECLVKDECGREDCLVKEECLVKDDLFDPKSNEECPVENELLEFTSEELSRFTGQYSPENLIGVTDLGKLYRGKMPIVSDQGKVYKDVTVKILVEDERRFRMLMPASVKVKVLADDERAILIHDSKLSRLEIRGNRSLMKVVGYCRKEIVGVVYDLNPLDTLHNLIFQDDFNWLQRVKTAITLARLLAYLHDRNQSYLIRNLAPSHIVVDQNFTPVLFEFGMLVGGVLGTTVDESDMRIGPCGYIDPFYSYNDPAAYSVKFDVYAFGVLLFNLTSKRALDKEKYTGTAIHNGAVKSRHSYVDLSFQDNADFDRRDGRKITELTRQCMDEKPNKRPEMKQVFERLKGLRCSMAASW